MAFLIGFVSMLFWALFFNIDLHFIVFAEIYDTKLLRTEKQYY